MGRRTDRLEYHGNTLTSREHFIYKGYVQIAAYKLDAEGQSGDCFVLSKSCYWDPSQPTATRILAMKDAPDATMLYAACDTVKNITALYDDAGTCRARYAYSPYGEKLIEEGDKHTANAFGFSSEYDDSPLGLYYYNYRYLNPNDGRWINRDPIAEQGGINLFSFIDNKIYQLYDILGKSSGIVDPGSDVKFKKGPFIPKKLEETPVGNNFYYSAVENLDNPFGVILMTGPLLFGELALEYYIHYHLGIGGWVFFDVDAFIQREEYDKKGLAYILTNMSIEAIKAVNLDRSLAYKTISISNWYHAQVTNVSDRYTLNNYSIGFEAKVLCKERKVKYKAIIYDIYDFSDWMIFLSWPEKTGVAKKFTIYGEKHGIVDYYKRIE